jgi:hypothetical protein
MKPVDPRSADQELMLLSLPSWLWDEIEATVPWRVRVKNKVST